MAEKIKKSEFVGAGAAVQAVGVIVCFIAPPVGLIAGVLLLIIGGRMAIGYKCSDCRGKVDKQAKVCQHCGARFDVLGENKSMKASDRPLRDELR